MGTTPADLFADGGEMGELMRRYDWNHHPLGNPQQWPLSLKTGIRVMLHSKHPIFIWWTREMYMFHNDAYVPLMGKKHPEGLGAKGYEVWAETWTQLGAVLEGILEGDEAFYGEELEVLMNRKGYMDETYWTFSYSAMPDDAGKVNGIFCACNEVTDSVLAKRRLKTIQDLSEVTVLRPTLQEAAKTALEVLSENKQDIPFSLLYLLEATGEKATLAAQAGNLPAELAPAQIALQQKHYIWPLATAYREKHPLLIDLPQSAFPLQDPLLEGRPKRAAIVPIARAGEEALLGFLVAGVSQRLEYGRVYQHFHQLLSGQLATALTTVLTRQTLEQFNQQLEVRVRERTQQLAVATEEIQATNKELRAANEEIQASNEELSQAQQQMVEMNQQLEAKVKARTEALQAALEENQLHRQQLLQQRELLERILGQVPASIATLAGPEHRYSFFNDHYQALSGNRTQLGLPVAEVFPEVVSQGFIGLLDQVYATGEPFIGQETPAKLFDPRTGQPEQRYVDFIYQPLTNEQGQTQGILAFILDVTEKVEARKQVEAGKQILHQLNQELAASNEELQAANEEIQASNEELAGANSQLMRINSDLDTFVYTASHDLKAPILNIEGLLKALQKQLGAESRQNKTVGQIYQLLYDSVECFKTTVGDLTHVARIAKDNSEDVTSLALKEVLGEVLLDLKPQIDEAGAKLEVELNCEEVHFSRKNLKSILYNLLSNAIKYRSPERVPIVRIACLQQADYQVLLVKDNGLGMDMRHEEKIFALFKRLHSHVEGTGIGLYMVKKMVENAGGKIEVKSQVGVGSTFGVHFKR